MKNLIVHQSTSIKDSLVRLEKNTEKCLLVTLKNGIFVGTLTDGDIRRAILKGANLDSKIKNYVQKKSFYLFSDDLKKKKDFEISKLIKSKKDENIDVVPVLSKKRVVTNFFTLEKLKFEKNYFDKMLNKIPLIIMAGGKGTRLKPFTNIFPKPLIPINNSPAVEHIIKFFNQNGVKKIFLSLNYKKKLIKSYFEDIKNKEIKYVEEKIPLGSAGPIGLLKGKIKNDFFVCNCDTITKVNLQKFYNYHKKGKFFMTLAVATKKHAFPYGSCELDSNGNLKRIIEKPHKNHLTNIGLYLMCPNVMKLISGKKILDMDQLIKLVKKQGKKIGVFPVSDESWIDVGEWSEYNKMIFKSLNKKEDSNF